VPFYTISTKEKVEWVMICGRKGTRNFDRGEGTEGKEMVRVIMAIISLPRRQ